MNLIPVGILGTGKYVPERILSNADLEKMVETSDEWIVTRTGIRERRIANADQASSDLALPAARRLAADFRGEKPPIESVRKRIFGCELQRRFPFSDVDSQYCRSRRP